MQFLLPPFHWAKDQLLQDVKSLVGNSIHFWCLYSRHHCPYPQIYSFQLEGARMQFLLPPFCRTKDQHLQDVKSLAGNSVHFWCLYSHHHCPYHQIYSFQLEGASKQFFLPPFCRTKHQHLQDVESTAGNSVHFWCLYSRHHSRYSQISCFSPE